MRQASGNYEAKEKSLWNKGLGKGISTKVGLVMFVLAPGGSYKECRGTGSAPLANESDSFQARSIDSALRAAPRKTLPDGREARKHLASKPKGVPGAFVSLGLFAPPLVRSRRWLRRQWKGSRATHGTKAATLKHHASRLVRTCQCTLQRL